METKMNANRWMVVVGSPKWDNWKNSSILFEEPDLSQVGKPIGIDGSSTFQTRREARKEAKFWSNRNPYWNFRAEKVKQSF